MKKLTDSRRFRIFLGFCAAAFVVANARAADTWQPDRSVSIVVPSAPGGGLDLAARMVQAVVEKDKLSNQTLTVLNKPGGGGTVGIAYMNAHGNDGQYVTVQALPLITNSITGASRIGLNDVTPLAQLLTEQVVFSVNGDSPIKSGTDLINQLRKDPSSVSIAVSSSPGGQSHDAAALVFKTAGINPKNLKVVFFDSGGEAVTALMGNHVTVAVTPAGVVLGPSKSGKVRMIAIPSNIREPGDFRAVPTWKEQGVDVTFSTWRVVVGPKNMTPAQIAWWDQLFAKVTASPEWAAAAKRNLWTPEYKNSAETRKFLDEEKVRLTQLLGELGIAKQ